MINKVGRGGCYALYFMVVCEGRKWYNQKNKLGFDGELKMDFRKTFDKIPENFDKYRLRYCKELFQELEIICGLNPEKKVLEIGPGTGQATEPILKTGCDYTAIELGENFTSFMKDKFGCYQNFHIVNADFEKYSFNENIYDLVYSAATIQWIPEEIAFTKTYSMLKPGGYLAMFMTRSDETSANPSLRDEIDKVYNKYFRVTVRWTMKMFLIMGLRICNTKSGKVCGN